MAKVPSSGFNASLPNVSVTPRNLGAEQEAVQRRSQALGNIANSLDRHAEELRIKDAAKYRISLLKSNNEYIEDAESKLGEDGIDVLTEYDNKSKDRKEKALGSISDGKLRDMVSLNYDSQSEVLRGRLAGHAIRQKAEYGKQLEKGQFTEGTRALRGTANFQAVTQAVTEHVELHAANNPNITTEQLKNFAESTSDAYTLSHFQEMVNRAPSQALQYYGNNEGNIRGSLTNDGLDKLNSLLSAAEKDSVRNSQKRDNDLFNAAIHDVNTRLRTATTKAEVVEARQAIDGYRESGTFGSNSAKQAESLNDAADARDKTIDKSTFARRVMNGEVTDVTNTQYNQANDSVFSEHMNALPQDATVEQHVGHIVSYFSNKNVVRIPEQVSRQFSQAQSTGNQQAIKESLVVYTQIQRYRPKLVDEFLKRDMKSRVWWSSMQQLVGADRSQNIYDQDITEYIKQTNHNVFEVDEFKRKKFNTEFGKIEVDKLKSRSDGLYRDLVESDAGWNMFKASKDWLINSSDTVIPKEAAMDYRNMLSQAYIYSNGNMDLAKDMAEAQFKSVYSRLLQAEINSKKVAEGKNAE